MRAWLGRLNGGFVTSADISRALAIMILSPPPVRLRNMVIANLTASTDLTTVDQFKNMIIKSKNGDIIRLSDVAHVALGAQNYNAAVSFDGEEAVYIGIKIAPSANLLTVIGDVKKLFPAIKEQLPEGLNASIVYDASAYVNSSIWEVIKSLGEAFMIVTVVIFLFLGSLRSVTIPIIAIPCHSWHFFYYVVIRLLH